MLHPPTKEPEPWGRGARAATLVLPRCEAPLILFVDIRTYVIWSIWVPPRLGNDSSVPAQYQRSLTESFAIALRHYDKLASSGNP
jgi:hypothetical protein